MATTWEHVRLMPGTRINEYRCVHCRALRYSTTDHGLRCSCPGARDNRTRRIARTDQKDVALPKMKRLRSRKSRAAACPEVIIQKQVNALLEARGLSYLRLPESLLASVFKNPSIPVYIKKHIKDSIGGFPDNTVFIPVSARFSLCCMLECKSDIGKLHGQQKEKAKELPYNVVRDIKEVELLLDWFARAAEMVKGAVRI